MKNILNQLGATAASLEGATPQELEMLGMNPMGPAVQGPTFTNLMTPKTDPAVIPPVVPTEKNFSPSELKDFFWANSKLELSLKYFSILGE